MGVINDRRKFLQHSGLGLLAPIVIAEHLSSTTRFNIDLVKQADWDYIRSLFPIINWTKIHFNSGSAGVMPVSSISYTTELMKELNNSAPYEVWSGWQDIRNDNLKRLAALCQVQDTEIRLTRNTTESLNDIISNIKLSSDDEILYAEHDYPYAHNAIQNRANRDGIRLNKIKVALSTTDDEIISTYRKAFTSKTKLLLLTHITHRQGQLLPIKELAEIAKAHGVNVLVDGAHAIGHIPLNISSLGIDYYASSLHKWLNAAHGTGLIYVNEKSLDSLHPFISSYESDIDKINQFDHLGTRAFYIEIALKSALDFHLAIGDTVKAERLHELTSYWINQVKELPRVSIHTRAINNSYTGVACFSIADIGAGQLLKTLDEQYNIHAKTVGSSWGSGVRISTNIFTSTAELDRLVLAIKKIAS